MNFNQTRTPCQIIKRKMAFFGHACRNNKCNLVKTCRDKEVGGAPGCNAPITSRSGQRHPWKKTKEWLKIQHHGVKEVAQLERLTSEITTPTTGVASIFVWGGHPADATRPMPPSRASVVYTFEALAGSWGSVRAPTVSRIRAKKNCKKI